jgi:hypothetical protein
VAVVVSAAAAAGATDMADHDSRLGPALAAATCSLLGVSTLTPVQAQETPRWQLDTALLYYGESDNRVQDASLSVNAKRDFDDDRFLSVELSVDTLTGASPSGATALGAAQTFTSPSGKAVYSTDAGEIPLDDTFKDTRIAASAGWTQPFARVYTGSAGLSYSTEYDYTHIGANFGLSRDFNQRNTTASFGVAWSQDDVDPVGGTPVPLSQMLDVGDLSNRRSTDSKDVLDVLFGVTQVINRTTVVRLNYSYSDASGYLNDPYKFLSVVDPATGDTLSRIPASASGGPSGVYRFENRPAARTKQALYAEGKKYLGGKALTLAYRYMTDDWKIDSHTLEARLRWPLGSGNYIEPHVRYYSQTAAEFYRLSLVNGQPLPQFASADYRLGEFDATTVGLKFGRELRRGREWSVRLEYYQQSGNVPSGLLIGNQAGRDQTPDLSAIIAQFSYRFGL